MTEKLGSALFVLNTDDKKFKQGIKAAESSAKNLAKRFSLTAQSISTSMRRAGKSMSMALTLPIVGIGTAILKMSGDFEQGMNKVKALTQSTGGEFDKLRDQARKLGESTIFSATQAADAQGFLAQAGLDASQIIAAMPATLDLAAAANMDLGSTADTVTNIMTAFGLESDQTRRVSDLLVGTFISSNTNLSELGEAMKLAAPVASAFGVSIEDTSAVLGLMANSGFKASLGGTSLRNAMIRLANPVGEAVDLIEQYGIQAFDSRGEMKPLADVIDEFTDAGVSAGDALKILGVRGGPAFLGILKAGGDAIRDYKDKVAAMDDTAREVATVMQEGLPNAIKKFKSALESSAIAIGESGLLEFATDMISSAADWFREFAQLNPEILNWGVKLAGVAAIAGPLLWIVGGLVAFIGALVSPIGLVVAAIIGVGGLIFAFTDWELAIDNTKQAWSDAYDFFRDTFAPLLDFIQPLIDAFNALWAAAKRALGFTGAAPTAEEQLGEFTENATMHSGGMIGADTGFNLPGLRSDERAIVAQVGEEVIPRGGGGNNGSTVNITIDDDGIFSGRAVRNLVERIRDELGDDSTTTLQVI